MTKILEIIFSEQIVSFVCPLNLDLALHIKQKKNEICHYYAFSFVKPKKFDFFDSIDEIRAKNKNNK